MLSYSEAEHEEMEAEFNAQYDSVRERFAGEDGSPEFNRSEYRSYLAEQEPATQADKDYCFALQYVKNFVIVDEKETF